MCDPLTQFQYGVTRSVGGITNRDVTECGRCQPRVFQIGGRGQAGSKADCESLSTTFLVLYSPKSDSNSTFPAPLYVFNFVLHLCCASVVFK